MRSRQRTRILVALALGVFAACSGPEITSVQATTGPASATLLGSGPNLLECPTNEAASSTSIVSALGGVIATGGTTVTIPAGALLGPTSITVAVPASRLMEVEVSAAGTDHFLFELPIVVTVSYARCTRSNIDVRPLSVWHIDSASKLPLELMPSIDNKLARTVTFTTGHLSGYAVAN